MGQIILLNTVMAVVGQPASSPGGSVLFRRIFNFIREYWQLVARLAGSAAVAKAVVESLCTTGNTFWHASFR